MVIFLTMEYTFEGCPHHNICLYNELNIQIGFEECIDIRRKVKAFEATNKDRISVFHPYLETICAGSVAEGFRHGQTDRDYVKVLKDITVLDCDTEVVYSREPNTKITLRISKDPSCWKEGYVMLKYTSDGKDTFEDHAQCIDYANINGFVSSRRFKEWWIKKNIHLDANIDFFIHGPCVSVSGLSSDQDIAFSLECPFWPTQAREWISRPRLWPSQKLVNEIVQNGCHIVPLGPFKDVKDDMLWRLSFNKAEQKLIFAFNQTQFLCYGLFKIVLKECIEKMENYPENTLCSYFIKTLMFWIIQETATDLWQPHNIVICYVMCFVRLLVWVKKEECPNFFIPSRNMFETKVNIKTKELLLKTLKETLEMGIWNCFAKCSKRFFINNHHGNSKTLFMKPYFIDQSFLRECRVLSSSFLVEDLCQFNQIDQHLATTSYELEAEFLVCQRLSMYQRKAVKSLSYSDQIKYFTKAKSLDLTRGPLMLATCIYCAAKYTKAIGIVEDTSRSLSKFTFYAGINGADITKLDETFLEYLYSPRNLRYSLREKREKLMAMDIIIHKETDVVTKTPNWKNIPDEIHFDLLFQRTSMIIHPLVYLYFLKFLCCKHLKRKDDASAALKELEITVAEVCKYDDKPVAHLILGILYEEDKRFDEAICQYEVSLSLRSTFTSTLCRSYLVRKYIKFCTPEANYDVD